MQRLAGEVGEIGDADDLEALVEDDLLDRCAGLAERRVVIARLGGELGARLVGRQRGDAEREARDQAEGGTEVGTGWMGHRALHGRPHIRRGPGGHLRPPEAQTQGGAATLRWRSFPPRR